MSVSPLSLEAIPESNVAAHSTTVSAVRSVAGTGLTGEYFSDSAFQIGYIVRPDAAVKFSPSPRRDPATVQSQSIRWTGAIAPTYSEAYSFSVVAGGSIRLWVNGQLLIDQARSSGGNLRAVAKISLQAGQKYSITIEYTRQSAAGVRVQLFWASMHQKLGPVPQQALFPDATVVLSATQDGLIGQYYLGKNFNKLVMDRVDPGINFNFRSATPSYLIPGRSPFSIRWTGQITPSYSETYTFSTLSDDGVRLYVDGNLLINNFSDHFTENNSAQITLVAGKPYDIRMDYYEDKGVARAQLFWSSPSQTREIVPASALSSTPPASAGTLTTTPASSSSIQLNWTGSPTATSYLIQQSTDNGITFNTIATCAAEINNFLVTGLNPATDYVFRVTPGGSSDTSTPSNVITTDTETASPAGLSAAASSATAVSLSWNDVAGEHGFAVYGAPVTSDASLGSTPDAPTLIQLASVPAGVTRYTVAGLTANTPYQFAVKALNGDSVASDFSNIAAAVTPTEAPAGSPATIVTSSDVTLFWNDVPGENGFIIERSIAAQDQWNVLATLAAGTLTYLDDTVQPGVEYTYRVLTVNAGGVSDPSGTASVITGVDAPAGLTSTINSSTQATISWADVENESGFAVFESIDSGATFSRIGLTDQGVTSDDINDLLPGVAYDFEIKAINSESDLSAPSAITGITTPTAAPADLNVTPTSTSTVNISWSDVTGETGFKLERSPDGIAGWTTVASLGKMQLSCQDTALTPGVSYFYRVSAVDAGGNSAVSTTATATLPLDAPTGLATSSITTASTVLHWTAVAGASAYNILQSVDSGATFTQIGTALAGDQSFAVSGLAAGNQYQFAIETVNSAGNASTPSAVISATTVPLSPTGLVAIPLGAGSASLTWTDVHGEAGFTLQRSNDGATDWVNVAVLAPSTVAYTDTTLAGGSQYYYRLTATNTGGNSAPSAAASVLTVPSATIANATGLSAAQTQVSWAPVTGANQYVVQRSLDGTSNWSTVATVSGALQANVPNPLASTTYYFRVSSLNDSGSSTPSATVIQTSAPLAQYALDSTVYGTTASGNIYAVDLVNGISTWIGKSTVIPAAPARDPITGILYFYQQGTSNIYSWNPQTGNTTLVDTSFLPSPGVRGAFRKDGTAFVTTADGSLRSVASGASTSTAIGQITVAGMPLMSTQGSMGFSSNGTLFLMASGSLYTVNTTTAVATLVGVTGLTNVVMTFGPKALLYTTTSNGNLYSLNPTSALASLLGNDNLPAFTGLAACPLFTHLSVTATASPTAFTKGQSATFSIQVSNPGGDTSSKPVSVSTTLPTGLSFTSAAGTGWTAVASGQVVTLTYVAGVAANGNLPSISLTVQVASNAPALVVTQFAVTSSELDSNLLNLPATVTTVVN